MVSNDFIQKGIFKRRDYKDYKEYINHQKEKLDKTPNILDWLTKYDIIFREILGKRLRETKIDFKGKNVLCLAARLGTEVKSFIDQGAFAVGIDLNPGKNNRLVVHGDFHHIQFTAESVDVVFTNSFDHAFEPEKLVLEIKRVLKKDGILIMENASTPPGGYESLDWKETDDILSLFLDGFELIKNEKFARGSGMLWDGAQVIFKKK